MMARNRDRNSLVRQVQNALDNKLAIGQSKHIDKIKGLTKDKIYSWETYRSYMKHCNYLVKYCKDNYNCKTLEDCRVYVDEYLKMRSEKGISAYTQKLEASAFAKMYGCTTKDFIKTDVRHRSNIVRSRGEKVRDYHFSEKRHSEFISFCRSTGLRRAEISALKGNKLLEKEGKYYIVVDSGSKGGRYREAPIIGDVSAVIERMKSVGDNKVFEKIPTGADIHSYRAEYCTSIYNQYARDLKNLERSEIYFCRGDLKGTWYDKSAMLEASRALGHNRISIIAEHYIRG